MTQTELDKIIARRSPEMAKLTHEVLAKLRPRFAGATEMVYDKKNSLVIGFCPNERPSSAIAASATYSKWINLYFFVGDELPDPDGLLQGTGSTVRSIRLTSAADLDRPAVKKLIAGVLAFAEPPLRKSAKRRVILRQSR